MVLQCTIEVGAEDYYSCDLTRKIPVRVTLVTINGDTGFGITESSTGDEKAIQDYIKGLEASPSIKELNILHRSQEAYWTRVVHQLGRPSIHETILDSGCMIVGNLPKQLVGFLHRLFQVAQLLDLLPKEKIHDRKIVGRIRVGDLRILSLGLDSLGEVLVGSFDHPVCAAYGGLCNNSRHFSFPLSESQ